MPPQTNQVPPQAPTPSTPPVQSASNGNMLAILAYLGILIIIPFVTEAKNDPFVKFHLKQGLTLIIVEAIGYVLAMIPVLGWILYFVLWIFAIVMTVTGIVNVVTGKQKELPIIGKYASKLNF